MSSFVTVNDLRLCNQGDGVGTVVSTVPDVCKLPPFGAPAPFTNLARAVDLSGGTTTVLVEGGHMAGHAPSTFATSTGDEGGSLGGVVSGTIKGRASWLSFSMNVFLEGQGACRLTDKMLLNDGNTLSMAGFNTATALAALGGSIDSLCKALLVLLNKLMYGRKGATGTTSARGLLERIRDQKWGQYGPGEARVYAKTSNGVAHDPMFPFANHERAIQELQAALRKRLGEFMRRCSATMRSLLPADISNLIYSPIDNAPLHQGPPSAAQQQEYQDEETALDAAYEAQQQQILQAFPDAGSLYNTAFAGESGGGDDAGAGGAGANPDGRDDNGDAGGATPGQGGAPDDPGASGSGGGSSGAADTDPFPGMGIVDLGSASLSAGTTAAAMLPTQDDLAFQENANAALLKVLSSLVPGLAAIQGATTAAQLAKGFGG